MKKKRFTPAPPTVCKLWIAACTVNAILTLVQAGMTLPEFRTGWMGNALLWAVPATFWVWQLRLSRQPEFPASGEPEASVLTLPRARAVLAASTVLATGGLTAISIQAWDIAIRYPDTTLILSTTTNQLILLAGLIGGAYDILGAVRRRAAMPSVTVDDVQAVAVAPPARTWWTNDDTREEVRNQSQRP